jgi:hypothetical protein
MGGEMKPETKLDYFFNDILKDSKTLQEYREAWNKIRNKIFIQEIDHSITYPPPNPPMAPRPYRSPYMFDAYEEEIKGG